MFGSFRWMSGLKASLGIAALAAATGAGFAQGAVTSNSTATSQLAVAGSLGNAAGVGVGPSGTVYYTDSVNTTLTELVGANGNSNILLSGLNAPGQVAVDNSRDVFVAAGTSNVVLEYLFTSGSLNLNSPVSIGTGLGTVTGVAVDNSGAVYIVDAGNKRVVKVVGTTQTVLATGLTAPKQIAVDRAGDVFVADSGANAIVYLPAGGGTASTVGSGLNAPYGVATDPSNNVYIADTGNNLIKEVPYVSGAPSTAGQTTLPITSTSPTSIAVDLRGTLYIAASSSVIHYSAGAIYFGLVQAGTTSQSYPVTLTFTAPIQAAAMKVVTQGYTGLDFNNAGGGTCSGTGSYTTGQTCTVNVSFTPQYPGPRQGAIVFYDSQNKILSRTFVGGGGLGPMLTFDPAVIQAVPATTTTPEAIALNAPHGGVFDAAGYLLVADTNADRIVFLPPGYQNNYAPGAANPYHFDIQTFSMNDVAVDGAGDLLVPDLSTGRMVSYPYENGTYSIADATVLGTGYSKPRVTKTDVAGNVYLCDNGNDRLLQINTAGVQTQISPGITKACIGIAVDLYGNVGATDNTAKLGVYIPANGTTPYTFGTAFGSPWDIAFDAAGSAYISDDTVAATYRVPNENGTIAASDQQNLVGNKAYSFALDPLGNIALFPTYGSTTTVYVYDYISRSKVTLSFGGSAGLAVGTPSAATATIIANAGNQTPVYTNESGIVLLGDIDDFSFTGLPAKPPIYPACNFSNNLLPGFACYVGVVFTPQSPGSGIYATTVGTTSGTSSGPTLGRQATVIIPSQAVASPSLFLNGYANGSAVTASAGLALAVTAPTTALSVDQAITVGATVTSAATGSITLSIDGNLFAAQEIAAGAVSFSIPTGLSSGSHTLSVTYSGDKTYAPVVAPVSIKVSVSAATPVLSIASSATNQNAGQPVNLTGAAAPGTGLPTPTGSLTFLDGTTPIGTVTLNSAGIGTLSTSTLAAGSHTITFSYTGDSVYAAGTSKSVTVVIGSYSATTTALTLSPVQPVGGYVFGSPVTATATVAPGTGTGTPTGTVSFSLDGAVVSQALKGTTASAALTPAAGSHVLTAYYSGDTTYASSSVSTQFITVKTATTTTLVSSLTTFNAGTNITLSATVAATNSSPTGTVIFRNGVAQIGTATLVKGVATFKTALLPAGKLSIAAIYQGDLNDATSTSAPAVLNVAFNNTTVTISSSLVIINLATNNLPAFTVSVGSLAPAGVITAPTGVVTFYVNGASIGSTTLGSGSASVTPTTLAYGVNYLTATYGGDTQFAASKTTAIYGVYVVPPTGYAGDYTLTMTPNPLKVSIGSLTTATVTVTPVNNYFGYVQVTCSNLPLYTNCILVPDQVLLDGTGGAQTMMLTVQSQSANTPMIRQQAFTSLFGIIGGPLLLLLMLGSTRRGRKSLRSAGLLGVLMILVMTAGLGTITACGSHPPLATKAGTYTVNITTTGSGGINHSFPMQFIFQ